MKKNAVLKMRRSSSTPSSLRRRRGSSTRSEDGSKKSRDAVVSSSGVAMSTSTTTTTTSSTNAITTTTASSSSSSSTLITSTSTSRPLLAPQHETPSWHLVPHLITQYRVNHDFIDSLRSWFYSHNDLINIWSHFLGLLYFLYAFYRVHKALDAEVAAGATLSWHAYALIDFQITCCAVQMLASVLYHTFRCVSPDHEDLFFRADLLGISVLIVGSYAASLHLGFGDCHLHLYFLYIGILMCFVVWIIATLTIKNVFDHQNLLYRLLGAAVAYGSIPCIHWLRICATDPAAVCLPHLEWYMLGMMGCYSIGYGFFMLRFPERFFPASFDLVGSSHQIWHFFVFCGSAFWAEAVLKGTLLKAMSPRTNCDTSSSFPF